MSDIDDYAEWTWTTWGSQNRNDAPHAIFGLAEEAGEVMGVFKRAERGDGFDLDKLSKELGDVIYYWCRVCIAHGLKPSEVLAENQAKLLDRKARGAIKGKGDDR